MAKYDQFQNWFSQFNLTNKCSDSTPLKHIWQQFALNYEIIHHWTHHHTSGTGRLSIDVSLLIFSSFVYCLFGIHCEIANHTSVFRDVFVLLRSEKNIIFSFSLSPPPFSVKVGQLELTEHVQEQKDEIELISLFDGELIIIPRIKSFSELRVVREWPISYEDVSHKDILH